MKTRFNIPQWLQGEDTPGPEQLSQITNTSLHKEYDNEGDEFIDDTIRIVDQDFGQIDGSFEAWKMRSARDLNK
jgi:hypothetical protein